MANNRMWLLHCPTGKAVYLGKRLAWGWYGTPENVSEAIVALFAHVQENDDSGRQDDFCLALEDCAEAPSAFDAWRYKERTSGPLADLEVLPPSN